MTTPAKSETQAAVIRYNARGYDPSMTPEHGGSWVCFYDYAALQEENARLKSEIRGYQAQLNQIAWPIPAEAELATLRASQVKPLNEWHRIESHGSILLYTLMQDGWRKGEPIMVNDVMVRIENANGSKTPIGPIANRILSVLQPSEAKPVADPSAPVNIRKLAKIAVRTAGRPTAYDTVTRMEKALAAAIRAKGDEHD